jgi:anti-sigma regulatory factor (Ser/Thr protein kinase)
METHKTTSQHLASLVFNADISGLKQLSPLMELFEEVHKMDSMMVFNINLIVEELVSNIIFYGIAGQENGRIEVDFYTNDSSFELVLKDNGLPFDPTKFESNPIKKTVEEQQIGGLGILFVKKITNQMRYERVNNQNHLYLSIENRK